MTLQELIKKGKLEKFDGVKLEQVTHKINFAFTNLNTADTLFDSQEEDENLNRIVYLNTYNAARLALQAFLLFKGFRTKGQGHHKTLIAATKILLEDESLDLIFTSVLKMSKNRNKIDYGVEVLDVSDKATNKALKDVRKLMKKISKKVEEENPQSKLQL